MIEKYGCTCADDVILNLRPLEFHQKNTDDGRLTYQAVVSQPLAPGSPMFALTLSTVLPDDGREQAEKQFRILRAGLLADFLLTEPRTDDDQSYDEGDGEPPPGGIDKTWEIQIVPEVLHTTVDGEYGVVFVGQAPIPGVLNLPVTSPGEQPEPILSKDPVFFKEPKPIKTMTRHTWTAKAGTNSTNVKSHKGTEYVKPPGISLSEGDHKRVYSDTVKISNYTDKTGTYTMTGRWKGPVITDL